jgi:hypothetical protein
MVHGLMNNNENHLEDQGVDERSILIRVFKKWDG